MRRLSAMLAVCAALATTTGLHAGACVDQLTTLQQALQLSHQPMLESVRQAQTYSELMLSADLARAETLDVQGNEEKCREAARRGPVLRLLPNTNRATRNNADAARA